MKIRRVRSKDPTKKPRGRRPTEDPTVPRKRRAEPGGRMKSQEKQTTDAKRLADVLSLLNRGATVAMIADHIGMDRNSVLKIMSEARAEYTKDIEVHVQENNAMVLATDAALRRTHMPLATGGTYEDPISGELKYREPNMKSAQIIVRLNEQRIAMNRVLMPQRMEVTGSNQGPIITASIEAMDAAALVQAEFGGNASITEAARGNYIQ
jgi:hypothetical protein